MRYLKWTNYQNHTLTCWHVGILTYWHVEVQTCWCVGLLRWWHVDLLACWLVEMVTCWLVGMLTCWHVDLLACWRVHLLACWQVDLHVDMSTSLHLDMLAWGWRRQICRSASWPAREVVWLDLRNTLQRDHRCGERKDKAVTLCWIDDDMISSAR